MDSNEQSNIVPAEDLPDSAIVSGNVPEDDLPDEFKSAQPVPMDDLPDRLITPKMKYGTIPQQIGAGLEGAAQGIAGPLATAAELGLSKLGVPGISKEDIAGRAQENPMTHDLSEVGALAGSMLLGTGEAALVGKAALKAAELAKLTEATSTAAKVGAGALKGAIETGLIQAGDNVSKALLGQGDPNDSVAGVLADGVGASSLIGGALGGAGRVASKALENAKNLHPWLAGLGEAAGGKDPNNSYARYLNPKIYDNGVKWWNAKMAALGIGSTVSAVSDIKEGYQHDDLAGGVESAAKDLLKGAGIGLGLKALSGPASAVLLKAISNGETNPRSLFQLLNYADQANSGVQKMNRGIESLFKAGSQQAVDKYDFDTGRRKLDKYIEDGGINQDINREMEQQNEASPLPQFAKGGAVEQPKQMAEEEHAVATHLPEQNQLLATAKGRISNYLSGLRPQKNMPKLAFDREPDQRKQKKSYEGALDIANHPLSILDKVKKGTIVPEDIQHFNGMYPELGQSLQKSITDRIVKSHLNGEKPSYAVKQGLSLLMGTPLSGDMLPQNMQAAQAVFKGQGAAQSQQGGAPKKSTAKLTKSNQAFLTGNQSLIGRQQKQ